MNTLRDFYKVAINFHILNILNSLQLVRNFYKISIYIFVPITFGLRKLYLFSLSYFSIKIKL